MAKRTDRRKEFYYRTYVTDAMKVGWSLNMRWVDLINEKPIETRSAEEIKDSIKAKIRGLSNGFV